MLPSYTNDPDLASIKVVATDMDCTLLADDGTMPPGMDELIERMCEAGMVFCAASGRPSYTLKGMFPKSLGKMAIMSDNGAGVIYKGSMVYKDLMAHEDYQDLIDFTLADGRGCPTVCGVDACFIRECDRVHDDFFRRFYAKIEYVDSLAGLDAEVNKYTVFFPERDAEEVYAETYRDAWGGRFHVTNAGREWIDIMNRGTNKGTGIAWLCDYLGIDARDVAAFGDTYNDIQMLEAVGHPFVVANAEEHMHAHAAYLAPSNNERGVATVIEAMLAARRSRSL